MKEVHTVLRTTAINVARKYLVERGYSEMHLTATTDYPIQGVKTFKLGAKNQLRYSTEPDIWIAGIGLDQFFTIAPVFRNDKIDPFTGQEFTMLAVYAKRQTITQIVSLFFILLREFEQQAYLPDLTHEPLRYVTYKEFNGKHFNKKDNGWVVVTDYPKDKSFYDQETAMGNTMRFGIFFIRNGKPISVATGGTVGDNCNKRKYIRGHIPRDTYSDRLIGFRMGLERMLILYEQADVR